MTHAIEARQLLRTCSTGALGTLSQRLQGHPFVSVVPFVSDYDGSPIVLISRLAEHTKNIAYDARVSLMVHAPNADIQSTARLTLAGRSERIDATATQQTRYIKRFPAAEELLKLDFEFHRITPSAIRYIGGFGKIHWIASNSFLKSAGIDARIEESWLEKLNGTHRPQLGRRFKGADTAPVVAIGLDCDGIDVNCAGRVHRLAFAPPVSCIDELAGAISKVLASEDV